MKLSSLDIRKQQFSRIVRGYDRDEVDAFLDMVSTQWQELVDEMRRAEEKLSEMKVQINHYQKVEEALEETIKGARVSADKKIEIAENSATAILEKAEARAVKITMNAEDDRLKIKRETAQYSIRQKEMLSKFKAFLTSELEMLSYHEGQAIIDTSAGSALLTAASILDDDLSGESTIEKETESDTAVLQGKQKTSGDKKAKGVSDKDAAAEDAAPADSAAKDSAAEDAAPADSAAKDSAPADTDSENDQEQGNDAIRAEQELSSDSVTGDGLDSLESSKHGKPSWTVNTLVSPSDSENSGGSSDSDRDATKPTGEMRAAQEEIDNLRKLLKDLE